MWPICHRNRLPHQQLVHNKGETGRMNTSMADRRTASVDTLLVGIDAACLPVLEPLFEADAVPTLQSIFDSGVNGPLESQIPPWTASAWPSMYTGTNPGKHGVFGFLSFDGYEWDVVNATHMRERTIWELLDQHGLSSVVVNAPVTHPPRGFKGALLPGYVAPEDPNCHPAGLLDDVREEIGEYRVYARKHQMDDEEHVDEYQKLTRMRGAAFRYLVDRFDPDFGFVQFQQTDTVFHEFPGDRTKVRKVYEAVDEQLEQILAQCDPDTVIVASDHGMGRYEGSEFRANEFLRKRGYVTTTRGGENGMPSWSAIWENELSEGQPSGTRESGLLERMMALAARFGVTSQRMASVLETVGLAEVALRYVPRNAVRAATEQVDFANSAAYVRSRIELGVRINLQGREPDGVVPPAEYESVRESIIDELRAVTTPDGEPLFEDVAPREQYFYGSEVENAVDIVTVPTDFDHFLSASLLDEEFGEPTEPWNHKRHGVLAATGVGVDSDAQLADAHLFDVAPTVLATLGVPRSEQMDGSVLPIVDDAGVLAYPEFDPCEEITTNDSDVESRLADLGYLE